jgi:hypothetical protein
MIYTRMTVMGPDCVKTRFWLEGRGRIGKADFMLGSLLSIRRRPECALPVSCCRPGRAAPFRYRRAGASSFGSEWFPSWILSCQRDAPRSGGVRASYPGSDRAALAQPQGRLRAPIVRSAAPCLLCTCSSARRPDRQWSNSDVVSYPLPHWCSDRLAAYRRATINVARGDIDEVLLAEAAFGEKARGHRLRQINCDERPSSTAPLGATA